jgi:hypothetical protein
MAALDAAVRMTESLAAGGALKRGRKLALFVAECAADAAQIPSDYWSVQADPQCAENVRFSAAVLIHVRGRAVEAARPRSADLVRRLGSASRAPRLRFAGARVARFPHRADGGDPRATDRRRRRTL